MISLALKQGEAKIKKFNSLQNKEISYVELKEFLIFKSENNQLSLLEALQLGRWGASGPKVKSYQTFVAELNKLVPGLGDEIKTLQPEQKSCTPRTKK